MKFIPQANGLLPLIAMACLVASSGSANAAIALIAGWDFQATGGGTAAAAAPNSPALFLANDGSQKAGSSTVAAIYLNGNEGSSSWTTANSGNEVSGFGGSSLNTSGTALSTVITSPSSLALLNSSANGKSIVIKLSTTGYQDLSLSYATQRTSSGFTGNQWAYSTDGTNFTNVGTAIAPVTNFAVVTVDLTAVSDIEDKSDVWLRYTFIGATSSSGNNRIDNLQITGDSVPESTTAVALLLSCGLFVSKRKR